MNTKLSSELINLIYDLRDIREWESRASDRSHLHEIIFPLNGIANINDFCKKISQDIREILKICVNGTRFALCGGSITRIIFNTPEPKSGDLSSYDFDLFIVGANVGDAITLIHKSLSIIHEKIGFDDHSYYLSERHLISIRAHQLKIQIVCKLYANVNQILDSFDIFPSMFAFINNKLYCNSGGYYSLTTKSFVDDYITSSYDSSRVNKYGKLGFKVLLRGKKREHTWNHIYDDYQKVFKITYKQDMIVLSISTKEYHVPREFIYEYLVSTRGKFSTRKQRSYAKNKLAEICEKLAKNVAITVVPSGKYNRIPKSFVSFCEYYDNFANIEYLRYPFRSYFVTNRDITSDLHDITFKYY